MGKGKRYPSHTLLIFHHLHTRMEKVYTQLNKLLNAAGDSPSLIFLKGQALVTLTTILLEFEVIRTQPRVFESFVGTDQGTVATAYNVLLEVLFDLISKVNSSADRVLRGMVSLRTLPLFFHSITFDNCF